MYIKKIITKFASFFLALFLLAMLFANVNVFAGKETVLHTWCWSFATISKNMKEISDAGYSAIQVSPIQECKINKNCEKCKKNGQEYCLCFKDNWYFTYQPTNFKIGNKYLGTRDEFIKMCQKAKEYDIKIIVDIVANHVSDDLSVVSDEIKNIPNAFHNNSEITDFGKRNQLTQFNLLKLTDLNTGNSAIQDIIKKYMNDCLGCGAWGFRYDAAKHIELPKEIDGDFGSDFWPNIIKNAEKNGAQFQYGEILQDGFANEPISKFYEYAQFMNVTATKYGEKIRSIIKDRNIHRHNVMNYECNEWILDPDKLVTWVESHDNYANSPDFPDSSAWMTDDEIKVGWPIVAGRAKGTPLFFSRPVGGGGGQGDNRFPEKTKIGDKGSDLFKSPEIVAVNKFRKAMDGQDEFLRSKGNKILMIERGTKGMIIVNLSNDQNIKTPTRLLDGIYVDSVYGNEFLAEKGSLRGKTTGQISVLTKKAD